MTHFSQTLLEWFNHNQRDLPWRKTYSPYHVWISEIMLQQTQVDRVRDFFISWCRALPDVTAVAKASEEQIHKLWEGLGYYSRARNIHSCARLIVKEHGGHLPENHAKLLALPGIGRYTAGAIMSLAFNRDYPVVDANVERLFARLFDISTHIKNKENRLKIWDTAEKLIPAGMARNFNQALMELGALVCTPKNPGCSVCPLDKNCMSHKNGTTGERPVLSARKKPVKITMATGVLEYRGKIFIQKRPSKGVWANLWEFPGGRVEKEERPSQTVVREYQEETELAVTAVTPLATVHHSYLNYRVELHCFARTVNGKGEPVLHAAQEYRWVDASELNQYAFPAGHRKLIDILSRSGWFANRADR